MECAYAFRIPKSFSSKEIETITILLAVMKAKAKVLSKVHILFDAKEVINATKGDMDNAIMKEILLTSSDFVSINSATCHIPRKYNIMPHWLARFDFDGPAIWSG